MTYEHPEVRRARQREEIRAQRGSAERAEQIARIEADKVAAKKRKSSGSSGRKTPENSTEIFGHAWPVWFQLRDLALEELEACAAQGRTTTYVELWEHLSKAIDTPMGNPWLPLPNLLALVAAKAYADYQLLPTALVSKAEGDGPDVTFFRTAATLGALPAADAPATVKGWTITEAQQAFWQANLDGLHAKFASAPTDT